MIDHEEVEAGMGVCECVGGWLCVGGGGGRVCVGVCMWGVGVEGCVLVCVCGGWGVGGGLPMNGLFQSLVHDRR